MTHPAYQSYGAMPPYGYQPPPPPRSTAGRMTGIFAILFFWTGSIGCALGFVSISQARRAGASATLGITGFVLGLAVFIGIFAYVLFGVLDAWDHPLVRGTFS